MKKILSLFLALLILNVYSVPAMAVSGSHAKKVVNASFVSDLNLNNASDGQIVQFRTTEDHTDSDGNVIPAGTIFEGNIKSLKKGRWAYRRAKARIVLSEMRLPDGTVYKIKGNTKRKVLKGSAIANISKGIVTFPFVLVVGVGGSCVIFIECITIAGILLVLPTSLAIAGLCGKLSNGVNCKKHSGDTLKIEYSLNQ